MCTCSMFGKVQLQLLWNKLNVESLIGIQTALKLMDDQPAAFQETVLTFYWVTIL